MRVSRLTYTSYNTGFNLPETPCRQINLSQPTPRSGKTDDIQQTIARTILDLGRRDIEAGSYRDKEAFFAELDSEH